VRESTGLLAVPGNMREARRKLSDVERQINEGSYATAKGVVVEKPAEKPNGKPARYAVWAQAVEAYLSRPEGPPNRQRQRRIEVIGQHLNGTPLVDIDETKVDEVMRKLHYQGNRPKNGMASLVMDRGIIKTILRHAKKAKLLKEVPDFEVGTDASRKDVFFVKDDRDKILAWCKAEAKWRRLWAIFQLQFYTGARPVELARLEWTEVELGTATPQIRVWTLKGKGRVKRWRAIPLHPLAVAAIEDLAKRAPEGRRVGRVILTSYGVPYSIANDRTPTWTNEWRNMLREFIAENGGQYGSSYVTRHSFAAIMRKGGRQLDEVGKLLGHTKLSTTQRYAHIGAEELRGALSTL
jgi:integrase